MTHEERYKDILALNPNFLKKTNAKYLANYLGITGHVNFVGRRNIISSNGGNDGLVELEITHFF